ncbi:hypothetical protein AMS68_006902 [Peltaster fructicola]|uniref:LAA1-like C-terminal TPR repeats domain-containing protein n=1 Tax=Peltaster fructicola TaxID=286661 RepID=A0A6H0Y380_9PEZI|nr:hypothetical protein AMS68_006902 [Peltaster fructicola]
MAENEKAPKAATTSKATDQNTPQLDTDKLHALPSEQQALYLLTFSSDLAAHVEALGPDSISSQQDAVKKELVKIICLTAPAPTRVIRNALARCYNGLYTKGNRRTLHESINELVNIISAGKEQDLRTKHAATYCLGAIFEAGGDSAVNLAPHACAALLRLVKPSVNDAGLRAAIFRALGKIVTGVLSIIDEDLARSIWKQARTSLSTDKSFLVSINAAYCIEQLVQQSNYFDNSNDFEKLQSAVIKAMDSPSSAVRRGAASCLALALFKSYTQSPTDAIPRIKKPKKSRKGLPEDGEDEIERTASPAPDKVVTLSHTLLEILRLLGVHYTRSTSSNRVRSALMICYIKVIRSLNQTVLEESYNDIAQYLLVDLLGHPSLVFHKYRLLITRKFVAIILEQVIAPLLGEAAQLNACRHLINQILKDYPQTVKERPVPSKQTLTGALSALNALLLRLGGGATEISDLCRDILLQVHQHPSFTVQTQTSITLRTLVLACPHHILPSLAVYQTRIQKELEQLGTPNRSTRRCVAYTYGLCSILSAASQLPLYGSVELYAKIMTQAITLLKTAAGLDLHVSACQIQIAWLMISGLMPLGPNFVKTHLQQLLLLWKNASPKPQPKESIRQRSLIELSFLTHVRECALSSVRAFLAYNRRLLTSDVSRRIAAILESSVSFVNTLPDRKTSEDPSTRLSPAFQLQDYEVMVNRRVLQCFSVLLASSLPNSVEPAAFSTILPLAVRALAAREYEVPNALNAAIATSAGSFDGIWDLGDNYGFGVTGLVSGCDWTDPFSGVRERHWTALQDAETQMDKIIRSPVCSAAENDPAICFMSSRSDPAATEVVNAAIATFALALPLQPKKVQETVLEQIEGALSSSALQRDIARRAAISVNVSLALRLSMELARTSRTHLQAHTPAQDLLRSLICSEDETVRYHASSAIGRLCSTAGTDFTTQQVSWLKETIINNRDPNARAGCSQALACINSHLGGMAAGMHIKNIVGILMSLSADSHPLVHFWATDSLSSVADSAGLNFLAHVNSCVGLLSQLYVSDDHNAETENLASSNMLVELPMTAAIGRGVASLINVLGPDLQDMAKARDMMTTLIQLFSEEQSIPVTLANLKCREHLSLYIPNHFQTQPYVQLLQSSLEAEHVDTQQAAAHGLCNLMRRDAEEIIRIAEAGLEDRLWDMLDENPDNEAVRKIFLNWLQQTAVSNPEDWIARCNTILTKAKAKAYQTPATAVVKQQPVPTDVQDEEVAGFAVTEGATKVSDTLASTALELLRWQVRLFAMECLYSLIMMIGKDAAVRERSQGLAALQSRIAEVIRIAFSASTANVAALRVIGLRIIQQVLKTFGRIPDPDFSEAMLLEQYQAQISSALTPAFAADSSPALAAEAVNVCATFISTGIVTDVERMGRTLKLLVSALESFSQSDTAEIGDLKGLSSNAQVMVRMSVFSAWAELQVASIEQKYLADVVKPHISTLVPLWLSSLREYARLRFEPDISAASTASSADDFDAAYAAFNRQTLLRFYQDAWLSLVDAIASLIDEDSQVVFDALDGKQINGIVDSRQVTAINYRDEPVAFFFVLFGLAFEALAINQPDEDEVLKQQRKVEILQALKKILRPSVAGDAIYQDSIFEETIDLMHRMVLTESLGVQTVIVEIATNLCMAHPSSRQGDSSENLSDDIEQLFELTRIMVLVLAGIVPGLSDTPVSIRLETSEEAVTLVHSALQALVNISDVFPTIIRTDLRDAILHIFVVILGTGACQAVVVPQALPMFRRLIASMAAQPLPHTEKQLSNALIRMLSILSNAQRGDNEASLACEKNTLLAGALLVSAAPEILSEESVQQYVKRLADCLNSRMTTRVAVGCIRTLLMTGVASKTLLSLALDFLVEPSEFEGVAESKSLMAQTLVVYVSRASSSQKPAVLNFSLLAFLKRADSEGSSSYAETAARIIDLSNIDNTMFRSIVSTLESGMKTLLGEILRVNAQGQTQAKDDEDREPTIALKLNF